MQHVCVYVCACACACVCIHTVHSILYTVQSSYLCICLMYNIYYMYYFLKFINIYIYIYIYIEYKYKYLGIIIDKDINFKNHIVNLGYI